MFVGTDARFEAALRSCLVPDQLERVATHEGVVSKIAGGRTPSAILVHEPDGTRELRGLRTALDSLGERPSLIPVLILSRWIPESQHDAIADSLGMCCLTIPLDVGRLIMFLEVAEERAALEPSSSDRPEDP